MIISSEQLLELLVGIIATRCRSKGRALVAVDGPDCSGKSTLCRSLVGLLKDQFSIILIHFDDYLNVRHIRENRGAFSAEAFLNDYFDEEALLRSVLDPAATEGVLGTSSPEIIIVEGLFLLRPRLAPHFDVRFRLEIEEKLLLKRAFLRDVGVLGTEEWVKRHYYEQCLPAQQIYQETIMPENSADVVIRVLTDDMYEISSQNTPNRELHQI